MKAGKWAWIPDRPQDKPPFDWQNRMPVNDQMRNVYNEACRAYDNSDGDNDVLSFEEVVLLQFCAPEISTMRESLHVAEYALNDLRIRYVAMFNSYVRNTYYEGSNPDNDLNLSLIDTDAAITKIEDYFKKKER
jgi:hypothetical protein